MGNGNALERENPSSVFPEIVWKPEKPTEFARDIPGHCESGMAGPFNFATKLASDRRPGTGHRRGAARVPTR